MDDDEDDVKPCANCGYACEYCVSEDWCCACCGPYHKRSERKVWDGEDEDD